MEMEHAGMKRKAEEDAVFENEQGEAQNYYQQQHSQPSEQVVSAIKSTTGSYANRLLELVNSLEDIAVHLNSCNFPETIGNDYYCDELSTLVNFFLEIDYRILPTHALDLNRKEQHPKTKTLKAAFIEVEKAFDVLVEKLDKLVPKDVASENLVLKMEIKDQKTKIKDHKTNIKDHVDALKSGTFFLSLDKVWEPVEEGVHGIEIDCNYFNRNHHVSTIKGDKQDKRYKDTAEGAVQQDHKVAANCVTSTDSSQSQRGHKLDIFGCPQENIDSAHLMPQSLKCSGRWFPIVPWILNLSKEQQAIPWSVRQKCIHGFFVPTDGGNETKACKVGIKHFPTNFVHLRDRQALFFDRSPCFLIVPAMEDEEVVNWSGDGYSAIVIAGDQEGSTITNAKEVYEDVGACKGGYEGEFLATKTDVSKARQLLENVLRCLAKTCQYLSKNENFVEEAKEDLKLWIGKDANIFFSDLTSDLEKIKFPVQVDLEQIESNFVRVRKVSFAGHSESQLTKTDLGLDPNLLHPAPDPMLLLLKSASNWLRRQNLDLLPACGPIGEDGDSDDVSSNFTATYSQECAARGWEMPKKVSEIACIGVRNTSLDDASLTDECD